MSDAFEECKYYSEENDDPESLSHNSPEEAMIQFFDDVFDPEVSIQQSIANHCPMTIIGWKRKVISPRFGEYAIDRMLEDFDESYFCEEYGNPFEDGFPPWEGERLKQVKEKFYKVMEECLKTAHVWQCEEAARKTFEEEEVLKIVKLAEPEWFKA
jgi:hypothetical protein